MIEEAKAETVKAREEFGLQEEVGTDAAPEVNDLVKSAEDIIKENVSAAIAARHQAYISFPFSRTYIHRVCGRARFLFSLRSHILSRVRPVVAATRRYRSVPAPPRGVSM